MSSSNHVHGRVLPSGAVPYLALESGQSDPKLLAKARIDPYYANVWTAGSSLAWGGRADLQAEAKLGCVTRPKHLQLAEDEAVSILGKTRLQYARLATLAALDSWRVLTLEQLAAMTGLRRFLNPREDVLAALFSLGFTDVSKFLTPFAEPRWDRTNLIRASMESAGVFTTRLAEELSATELLFVTGGYPWSKGVMHDRHNLLCAELCLRIAEWCPNIGTILGEKFSLYDMLTMPADRPTAVTYSPDRRRADATIVRADGARIAVELTANSSARFDQKVEHWCRALEAAPLSETGLFVVFVSAANPGGGRNDSAAARIIARVTSRFSQAVRRRIGWVPWRSWFPNKGYVSPEFLSMTVACPTGDSSDRWEQVKLLDPTSFEFAPRDKKAARAVIRNSAWLGGVPALLRERIRAPQPPASALMDDAPIAEPERRDRQPTKPFGMRSIDPTTPVDLPPGLQVPTRL